MIHSSKKSYELAIPRGFATRLILVRWKWKKTVFSKLHKLHRNIRPHQQHRSVVGIGRIGKIEQYLTDQHLLISPRLYKQMISMLWIRSRGLWDYDPRPNWSDTKHHCHYYLDNELFCCHAALSGIVIPVVINWKIWPIRNRHSIDKETIVSVENGHIDCRLYHGQPLLKNARIFNLQIACE